MPSKQLQSPQKALDVAAMVQPMHELHASGVNQTYEWRIEQLKRLRDLMTSNLDAFIDAVRQDLGRNRMEALVGELALIIVQIDLFLANLRRWMEPKKMPSPFAMFPARAKLEYKPLREPAVCIIAAFNFPVFLCFQPAIGALAAGNPVVLKPSELCPASAGLISRLVGEYFPPNVARIVTGAVAETQALLKQPWGKIVFTGSERVGRIVAQAAAATLTPVILELGGKCPVYVDGDVPPGVMKNVADRIVSFKIFNSGQVCVAPDTLIVHKRHAKQLSCELVQSIERQFGKDPSVSEMARIVSRSHAERLVGCIEEVEKLRSEHSDTEVLFGGSERCKVDDRYVCPTLVLNPPPECRLMREEIFGPVLPIVVVPSRQHAIEHIRYKMAGTPLGLFVFTSTESTFEEIKRSCPAACAFRNDSMFHTSNGTMPFGGLDTSGMGRYQGKASFEAFSHVYPTFYRPLGSFVPDLGFLVGDRTGLRYHPHTEWKNFLFFRVLPYLPDIPVIPWKALTAVAVGLVMMTSSSSIATTCCNMLADGLTVLADYLRT